MIWWVRKILNTGIKSGRFALAEPTAAAENTYRPGDHAPTVRRVQWVRQPAIIDWTADDDAKLNAGFVAGMEFRRKLGAYRNRDKRIPADVAELLDLAERAISPQGRF